MHTLDTTGDHHDHAKMIKEEGKKTIQEGRDNLNRFFDREKEILAIIDIDSLMLSTPGSDGRYEKGIGSKLDLQIVTSRENHSEKITALTTRIKETIGFDIENIEYKRFGIDNLTLFRNNPDLVFPTRFFDSTIFYDPSGLRPKILRGISEEIIGDVKLAYKMYDRFRTHKIIMNTGKEKIHGSSYESYNLDEGIFHYDPENFKYGVKNGPMRYIQYLLAVSLMRYIRDTKGHPGFLDELPTNITDRLNYIENNALSSKNKTELDRIQYIYEFFLHMYHEMQHIHHSEGDTEFIVEDRDALRDIREMLNCLHNGYKIEHFYPVKN